MNFLLILLEKYSRFKKPIQYWRRRGAEIGENCEIYSSASLGSEPYLVKIGNHVRINDRVTFVTHDGGVWVLRECSVQERREEIDLFGKICVGNNVHIGTGAIIMPNVMIGNNVIIGCGAVVTKSVPDNTVVAGVPARVIETISEYEKKHEGKFDYTKRMNKMEKQIFLTNKYLKDTR